MEKGNEGDEIILLAFRQIDCNIDKQIVAVAQLTAENIIDIAAKSLYLITDGETKFSPILPSSIASRHRTCTSIATKIKELGYTGDCGYNQLLYPVENQTRLLLAWFIQKLPRSEEERTEEVLGASALLNLRINNSLISLKNQLWTLPFCSIGKPLVNRYESSCYQTLQLDLEKIENMFTSCAEISYPAESSYLERHRLQIINEARNSNSFENSAMDNSAPDKKLKNLFRLAVNSVIKEKSFEDSSSGFSKSLQELIISISEESKDKFSSQFERGSRFSHATEFSQESSLLSNRDGGSLISSLLQQNSESEEEAELRAQRLKQEEEDRDLELKNLRSESEIELLEIDNLEKKMRNMADKSRQLESELSSLASESESLERDILIKKKVLEMLPAASENIKKLQAICSASAAKLMQLSQEWETHRRPLLYKLRDLRSGKTKRRNLCKILVEEMRKSREEMQTMVQDLKLKQEKAALLTEEVKKLPKNINRAIYTRRIMDIITSISKQGKEIQRITVEIRDIQKTINTSTSSLQRADAVAEELIYSAANNNNDSAMVEAYRQLRALRVHFDELINSVNKIGQVEKSSRQLETKIDQELSRLSSNNSDRVKRDLAEVLKENAKLVEEIKSFSRK